MKNILTHYTARASRGAFRSSIAAIIAVGASLAWNPAAHGWTGPYAHDGDSYFLGEGTAEVSANWVVNFGTTVPLRRNTPVLVAWFYSGRIYIYTPILGSPGNDCLGVLIDTGKHWKLTSGNGSSVSYELQFGSYSMPFGTYDPYLANVNTVRMPQPGSWTNFATPGNNQILPSMSDVFRMRTASRRMVEKWDFTPGAKMTASVSSNAVLKVSVTGQIPSDMNLKELNGRFAISLTAK